VPAIRQRIAQGTVVHADESSVWNSLHARFAMRWIKHQDCYSVDGACTNGLRHSHNSLAAMTTL